LIARRDKRLSNPNIAAELKLPIAKLITVFSIFDTWFCSE
jgi:hypothetical protein